MLNAYLSYSSLIPFSYSNSFKHFKKLGKPKGGGTLEKPTEHIYLGFQKPILNFLTLTRPTTKRGLGYQIL